MKLMTLAAVLGATQAVDRDYLIYQCKVEVSNWCTRRFKTDYDSCYSCFKNNGECPNRALVVD